MEPKQPVWLQTGPHLGCACCSICLTATYGHFPAHKPWPHGTGARAKCFISSSLPWSTGLQDKKIVCLIHTSSQPRGGLSCTYSLLQHPVAAKCKPFPAPASGTGNVIFPLQLTSMYIKISSRGLWKEKKWLVWKGVLAGFWVRYRSFESLWYEAEIPALPSASAVLVSRAFRHLQMQEILEITKIGKGSLVAHISLSMWNFSSCWLSKVDKA